MQQIQNKIKSLFRSPNFVPDKPSLVNMDGYDELEKGSAVEFFRGKNVGGILKHLQNDGPYYLDEWTVLKLDAIIHYAPAYFSYLIESLESKEPEEEFVFFFIGALYQLTYIHKGSPFSSAQTDLIIELVELAVENSKDQARFEYFSDDIQDNAKEFRDELNKYSD